MQPKCNANILWAAEQTVELAQSLFFRQTVDRAVFNVSKSHYTLKSLPLACFNIKYTRVQFCQL